MGKYCVLAGTSVRNAIETQAEALRAQLGLVRAEDPDGIHDMRVASRRLRAVLGGNQQMFGEEARQRLHERIREITSVLGKPRELDVTLQIIERRREDFHGPARYALNHAARQVRAQRGAQSAAIARGAALVASPDFERELAALFKHFEPRKHHLKIAIENTDKRRRKLAAQYAAWRDARDEAGLHALRIAFKKMRYACETYADLYGSRMKDLIGRLKDAQESLGEWHDYDILLGYIRQATPGAPPRAAQGMPEFSRAMEAIASGLVEDFASRAAVFFKKPRQKKMRAFLRAPAHKCRTAP